MQSSIKFTRILLFCMRSGLLKSLSFLAYITSFSFRVVVLEFRKGKSTVITALFDTYIWVHPYIFIPGKNEKKNSFRFCVRLLKFIWMPSPRNLDPQTPVLYMDSMKSHCLWCTHFWLKGDRGQVFQLSRVDESKTKMFIASEVAEISIGVPLPQRTVLGAIGFSTW